jgi:uncharacterized protein YcnI
MKEPLPMRRAILAAAAALALLLPAGAAAHVSVVPATAPAGGFARLDVRVPNERADAGTVRVDVRMPPGVISASYEPVPGWSVRVRREKLAEPVQTEDGFEVDEQIAQITWSGGVIPPGAFQDFRLSLRLPAGQAGDELEFKALQTYRGGEVVRWIGPQGSEEPAPVLTLTAAATEAGGHGAAGAAGSDDEAAPAAAADDGGGDGLAIAALVVGALGLAAGVAGLLTARRAGRTA